MSDGYGTRLLRKEVTAVQTATFYCEKPTGFRFTAGQFIELTLPLPDSPDEDKSHTFSICSAPFEDWIAFTTRLRDSPFKQALTLLEPSAHLTVDGPYGNFVVSSDTPKPVVFLAGGVGITPAISILKQQAHDSLLAGSYLFYSNRTRDEAPFVDELVLMESKNSNFHLIATMTADPTWAGETERINMAMIAKHVDPAAASFYISGPPNMTKAMRDMLLDHNVRAQQIKYEAFSGY